MTQRLPDLNPEALTPEQQKLSAQIASTRSGVVAGPFAIWLRLPQLAAAADALDCQLRLHSSLDKRYLELAVLVVARAWTAQYEWHAHEASARAAGIEQGTIDAIRTGHVPAFTQSDERIVYQVATEIANNKSLSDEAYQAAVNLLGVDGTIELITAVGFYALVAVVVTSYRCPVPGGATPLPALP
jgi:4-carboxymuconolactone decarboxylase